MLFHSRFPAIETPDVSLTQLVLRQADELGDKPAIIDAVDGQGYTYRELAEAISRLAAGLAQRGIRRGDAIAVLCPNVPQFPVVFHGALTAGAVVTTLNPLYTPREIAHQLRDSRARMIFTVAEHVDKALEVAGAEGVCIEDVVVVDSPDAPLPLEALLLDAVAPAVTIDPLRDLAALPYSSGTTGLPKGVMLTHGNLAANVLQTAAGQKIGRDDVVMAILPFFHIYGMTVTMNYCLWAGATIVTARRYDASTFPAQLQDRGITRLYAVPPIILGLAKRDDLGRFDLSRLRGVLSGAAPLDAKTARLCAARLGCRVTQGYGLTETSPCTHLTPIDDERVPAASIGPALPSTECRIIDPETQMDAAPGAPGELWIRGPQVMAGYLDNPDATAATVDADGFLHTGDLARVDDDGYFYIVDRLKELIKYNGFQIAPAELEAILVAHPGVADAAVIGIHDADAGELPKALVVVTGPVDESELISYVAERVSPQKRVRRVEFVDAIPRSASGKILRRELRDRERQAAV